nr:hypothetical protein [Campylobacter sp.]
MQITLQIQNGNQNIFNALKAFLKTHSELDFDIRKDTKKTPNGFTKKFENEILKESNEAIKAYKNGKIKAYSSAKEMHKDILNG